MIGVALATTWVGYWLTTYGLSQLRGCNAGLLELAYKSPPCNPDGSSSSSSKTPPAGSGAGTGTTNPPNANPPASGNVRYR